MNPAADLRPDRRPDRRLDRRLDRRRLLTRAATLGLGALGAGAALTAPGLALAQTAGAGSPPLAGKFASPYYMQFQPGQPVPVSVEAQGYTFPVEWYDTSGTARTIRDYLGTVTLIQFWRTRCPACVLEVPALDKLAPQLEGPKFRLIAIALKEDSLSDIERFYARYQIRNLEILHDRDHLAFSQIAPAHPYYGVRSTPTTVLVDPRGNYISAYSGVPGWEKPEGVQLLKWIIDNA